MEAAVDGGSPMRSKRWNWGRNCKDNIRCIQEIVTCKGENK